MRALGACRSASARSCWRHAWTASRKGAGGAAWHFGTHGGARAAARAGLLPRACRIQGRIDDFQPLLQIGRQGAGQRGRGLGAAHPVRAGHAARRAGVAGMVRAQRRAAAFERARRAWVDIGQAGRAFRAAHPRAAAAALARPGRRVLLRAGLAEPARPPPPPRCRWAGGPAWKDWARTTARRWASSARSTGAAGRPWSNWTPAPA